MGEGKMELNVGGKAMKYEVGKIAKFPSDEDEQNEVICNIMMLCETHEENSEFLTQQALKNIEEELDFLDESEEFVENEFMAEFEALIEEEKGEDEKQQVASVEATHETVNSDLKALPDHLKYAYLESNNTEPVIVNA